MGGGDVRARPALYRIALPARSGRRLRTGMSGLAIRDAVWPKDTEAAIGFIDGLQLFEHGLEPNRRIDAQVGAEYLDVLLSEC